MEQSEKAKEFLAALDPESLKVGDGSNGLPVWIGVDAEAQRVYRVYASGLVTGFGDGDLVSRVGVGPDAGRVSDVNTMGRHLIHAFGEGMDRKMHFMELKPEFAAEAATVDMSQVLFELHGPDGQVWTLAADGQISGFPKGTKMANYAAPVIYGLIGKLKALRAPAELLPSSSCAMLEAAKALRLQPVDPSMAPFMEKWEGEIKKCEASLKSDDQSTLER